MIEGSGSIPLSNGSPDPDPGGPKTRESGGSGYGFGSATLLVSMINHQSSWFYKKQKRVVNRANPEEGGNIIYIIIFPSI